MALTDLLNGAGRVVQAAALGLAVYGCGGSEKDGNSNDRQNLNVCERICADVNCIEDFSDYYASHPNDPLCVHECYDDIFEDCSYDVLAAVSRCLDVKDENGSYCNDPWLACLDKIDGLYECARIH